MKITLFIKPSIMKVGSLFVIIYFIVSNPSLANASFFSDLSGLTNSVFGRKVTADEISPSNSVVHNSQNIPLLESSVNPDMKNIKETEAVVIVDDEALSPDTLLGTDSETNSYISSTDKIATYTVKAGDTIGGIANKFNISKNTIIYANTNIKNNVLKVGQTLIILPVDGISYTVKKGDTISSIAKAYKADANDISEYNDISISGKGLQVGEIIVVPGGTVIAKKLESVVVAKVQIQKDLSVQTAESKTQTVEKNDETIQNKPVSNIATSKGITGGYIWPFPAGVGSISQKLHDDNAYDMRAPKGTPIYAIQDGKVLIADGSGYNGGYGLYVVVDFDDGAQAIFGHMSKVAAIAGQTVQKGDIIGYVGSTGRSTGNHVHIGYRGGKPNPYRNLPLGSTGL